MNNIYELESDKLSWYRTDNVFERVADVENREQYLLIESYAEKSGMKLYPLGNGSNTFFKNKQIKSLILRNKLKQEIVDLGDDIYDVTSSVKLIKLLKYALERKLSAPYNLASVPATVGGAVAMNAGTGPRLANFFGNYVVSVTVWRSGEELVLDREQLGFEYRKSVFSENYSGFVVSVRLRLPKVDIEGNPIKERIEWSKKHQSLGPPNCGSVYRAYYTRLMKCFQFIFRKHAGAYFSRKSPNWISNESKDPKHLRRLLLLLRCAHWIVRKKSDLEIRVVE